MWFPPRLNLSCSRHYESPVMFIFAPVTTRHDPSSKRRRKVGKRRLLPHESSDEKSDDARLLGGTDHHRSSKAPQAVRLSRHSSTSFSYSFSFPLPIFRVTTPSDGFVLQLKRCRRKEGHIQRRDRMKGTFFDVGRESLETRTN